ncbi:MAG TPA: choice-of-anchor D domain-containing protein, partial [Bryobacteraceae bacterium]|nr:choice-of-anchor D domain-containing protein [Bryobacteraceae bacterium]
TNSLSFGSVPVNSTAALPLTLTSSGTAPLTINAATLTGTGFTDSGASFPITLNPNQSVTLQVHFDPKTAGGVTGQLTITSNSSSGATTVVQLSGTGTTAAVPQLQFSSPALSFGNVPVGSTATLSLTLISSGTAAVTVSSAALTGTGFSDSGATFPVTLNPNQSVSLKVQFDPTAAGAASGQLTIKSNSTTGGTTQISLSGTGTAVQHSIDLTWDAPSSSADPVAGYNVYRSTDNGSSFSKMNGSPDSQTAYTDNAVQSGTTYVYQVKSVDANGVESSASNQISLPVP